MKINTENDAVELYQDTRGKYRWHRFDEQNGNILSDSGQGYVSQEYALAAATAYNSDLDPETFILTPERR